MLALNIKDDLKEKSDAEKGDRKDAKFQTGSFESKTWQEDEKGKKEEIASKM